jgi:uncharacterized protein (UPF0210 family)
MDAPKVRKVLSSTPITMQAAHDLLVRFLQNERQDEILLGGVDEVLTRLEAVCRSLTSHDTQEIVETDLKKAKKAAKRKRRSEESSRKTRVSKKIKP